MTAPKILIIDDEESVRLLVAQALKAKGYLVSMAADGEAGLAQIRAARPDAVLCDVTMPGIDGYEVLRQVRMETATAGLPFILLTSADDRGNARRPRYPRADDYLSKPVTREELIAAVDQVLKQGSGDDPSLVLPRPSLRGATTSAIDPVPAARPAAPTEALPSTPRFVVGRGDALTLQVEAEPEHAVPGYKMLSRIGDGGMSSVYLADDLANGRRVVLKLLKARRSEDERMLERFLQESAILKSIHHEHVVRVFDRGFADGMAYIVMEHLSGGSLREVMDGGLTQEQAVALLSQAVDGLAEIHRHGVIHRDIKPTNLMLRAGGMLVLADFGIAKRVEQDNSNTVRGEVLGTPHYMSPEQAQGGEIGPRADIYSLGAIFYEMLSGQRLFPGETMIEILSQQTIAPIPRLAGDLARYQPLIDGMLAKRLADRFADADAVRAAIGRL